MALTYRCLHVTLVVCETFAGSMYSLFILGMPVLNGTQWTHVQSKRQERGRDGMITHWDFVEISSKISILIQSESGTN